MHIDRLIGCLVVGLGSFGIANVASAAVAPGVDLGMGVQILHQTQATGGSVGGSNGGASGGYGGGGGAGGTPSANASASPAAVGASTASAVEAAGRTCAVAPVGYRVDCLSAELAVAAQRLPNNRTFREAKEALQNASDRLKAVSRAYRDTSQPRIRVVSPSSGKRSSRPINAVQKRAERTASRDAQKILSETQTILLRAAGKSADKAGPYAQIAQALNSNKVILRS